MRNKTIDKGNNSKYISLIKLHVLTFSIVGLIAGLFYSVVGLLIDSLVSLDIVTSTETTGLSSGTILAFGAVIGMPIIGAIVGLLIGILQTTLMIMFPGIFARFEVLK